MYSITHLPIVLKGILTPEDAVLAAKHGASAIIVSNHGAREFDGGPATVYANNYCYNHERITLIIRTYFILRLKLFLTS